ncbi:hypothetical protein [Pleionea litopenaei]|uniref:Uncharacterized protein n=1 Tax=Pleionea litopenaei TaxID=3070815 RepID=A0AA51RST5_9GAMM|nr:hypothetical protein [Pleionea sp. HL-JVS1]WMS87018.1 hypothetical protein Q9312_17530 [Pleionea sp. HL-JVS1]
MSNKDHLRLINLIPKNVAADVEFTVKPALGPAEKLTVEAGDHLLHTVDPKAGLWTISAVVDGVKTEESMTLFADDFVILGISHWHPDLFKAKISSSDLAINFLPHSIESICERYDELSERGKLSIFEQASQVLLNDLQLGKNYTVPTIGHMIKILSRHKFKDIKGEMQLIESLIQGVLNSDVEIDPQTKAFLLLQMPSPIFLDMPRAGNEDYSESISSLRYLLQGVDEQQNMLDQSVDLNVLPEMTNFFDDEVTAKAKQDYAEKYAQQHFLNRSCKRLKAKSSVYLNHLSLHINSEGDADDVEFKSLDNLTVKLCPEDDFSGRSKKNFGIGELVSLSLSSKSKLSEQQLAQLYWRVESGSGYLFSNGYGEACYVAGAKEEQASLVLSYFCGEHSGEDILDVDVPTVAPVDATMVQSQGTGLRHIHNTFSVGFKGEILLTPDDVSYANVTFREGTCVGVGTGWLNYLNGEVHAIGTACTITNNRVNGIDTVFTGSRGQPYGVGDFNWPIPWQYREGTGNWTTFTTANHHQTSGAEGQAMIEKKGAGPFTKNAADPDSNY